jgi:hypothetical protein
MAAGLPPARALRFEVWRKGRQIGRHVLTITGDARDFAVAIDARISVGIGPIVLYGYHHQATETWRDERFVALASRTVTNGRAETVRARRSAAGVEVEATAGHHILPASALPLTHWNAQALGGAVFNPQTGAPLRLQVRRQDDQTVRLADGRTVTATRFRLNGDLDFSDWYGPAGDWLALTARAQDGSQIDYRRAA